MLITALILGFAGSLHCVAMCGPIALALPSGRNDISNKLLYNLGRITTYAMLGTVMGTIGAGIQFAGLQQGLSIGLGVLMIIFLLFTSNRFQVMSLPFLDKPFFKLKQKLAVLLKSSSPSSLYNIGLLNGFLPCGMVYLALSGAMATGDVLQGIGFMVLFGLGTFPAMMAISLMKKMIKPGLFPGFQKILVGLAFVFACLLIIRGLGLDIPYLSPDIGAPIEEVAVCD